MKQHSLHHSIYICEVKLKILMETLELLGRLPVWRNKLCGPCFLLCCAYFVPFFQLLSMTVHQYDKWLCKTVHDLWWFDLFGQNFILCYGNQRCKYTSLWKSNSFLKRVKHNEGQCCVAAELTIQVLLFLKATCFLWSIMSEVGMMLRLLRITC